MINYPKKQKLIRVGHNGKEPAASDYDFHFYFPPPIEIEPRIVTVKSNPRPNSLCRYTRSNGLPLFFVRRHHHPAGALKYTKIRGERESVCV